MADEQKAQVVSRYSGIVASIANNAVVNIEGITNEIGLVKYKFGWGALKDRNVHVYIDGDFVSVDMYVNVDFGYSVPEVVCNLQEKIKREVEDSTRYKVKKINVHVANINFN